MRRFARIVLLVVGTLLSLAGLAAAVLVGPNDTITTGEHELSTETVAVTTSSSMLEILGPTLHAAVTSHDGEVFVGIGHEVDVRAYLADVAYDEIREVSIPWSPELHRSDGGAEAVNVAPDTRDWWYAAASGAGRQEVSLELTEEPVNVVVMAADGEPPLAADLELGLEVDNLFITALLVLGIGLSLLATAIFVLKRRRRRAERQAADPVSTNVWVPSEERQL